jgi:TorA maturation chaperone TorD
MSQDSSKLSDRADFYLCLARAFLPPVSEREYVAMREYLAPDLENIAAALGHDVTAHLADYRRAIALVPDSQSLLAIYSRLFLQPPAPVRINTCFYLDGGVLGGACDALVACYRSRGMVKRDDFRDLPDHVSAQLEFAALLFATQGPETDGAAGITGGEFLGRHVAPWVGPFLAALERMPEVHGLPNPYLFLARVLERAMARDAVLPGQPGPSRKEAGVLEAREQWRDRGITRKDMEIIAERLRAHGLSADHLDIPCEQRDAERGWERRRPR